MSTQFNCQIHFYFKLFKQLFITIQFCVNTVSMSKIVQFKTIQFSISTQFKCKCSLIVFHKKIFLIVVSVLIYCFSFTRWSVGTAKSTIRHVLVYCWLSVCLVVWPRFGEPFVFLNPVKFERLMLYIDPRPSRQSRDAPV